MTIDNLSGSWENFDDTLRNWYYDNWNSSNTRGITPRFISPSGQNDDQTGSSFSKYAVAWFDNEQEDQIVFNVRSTTVDTDVSTGNVMAYFSDVFIDVQAVDSELGHLFANELNRITFQNKPDSGTRINKTDGSASAISLFEENGIDFNNVVMPETEKVFSGIRLAGVLTVRWFNTI
jgi:hypothetical protein